MTALLVGNYAPDRQYSMTAFQEALAQGLSAHGVKPVIARPLPRLGAAPGPLKKWRGYFDKYVLFPAHIRRAARHCDLVHVCDQGNAMYLGHAAGRPSLLTCHDLLALRSARGEFPDWRTGKSGVVLQEWIARSIPRASHVACVSSATVTDLDRLLPECHDRRSLLLNGRYRPLVDLEPGEAARTVQGLGLVPGGYLMHIGVNVPYKNRIGLLHILAALQETDLAGVPLAAAGGDWLPELASLASDLGVSSLVCPIPHPSDRQVASLYTAASGFLFPSTMEGFGLPVIEAQSYGCPVFCSAVEPLLEIVADSAATFDPREPENAAKVVEQAWSRRDDLRQAGLANSERFRTDRMVADYARLYASILGK